MRDSWVGLQAGVDARAWARLLRRAHEAALHGGPVPTIVRGVIADSWQRCEQTGVDPGQGGAPLAMDPDAVDDRWREHPLSRSTDVIRDVLGDLLYEARHIVVAADADGCLLWSDGHPDVLAASERILFTPGHAWSESAAGTNAVGTALAADHAVQVFSAEHYRSDVHQWQCSGAPIHDPETGRPLGAVDVTGRWETASAHTLALVQMAARLIEERLRTEMLERDGRILERFAEQAARHPAAAALSPSGRVLAATGGWLARGDRVALATEGNRLARPLAGGQSVDVRPLGDGRLLVAAMPPEGTGRAAPAARRGRRATLIVRPGTRARFVTATAEHRLTLRHSEIAELLARHPDGLGARELSRHLYGEDGHEVAVRAELHRLREVVGPALGTRPYRLQDVRVVLP